MSRKSDNLVQVFLDLSAAERVEFLGGVHGYLAASEAERQQMAQRLRGELSARGVEQWTLAPQSPPRVWRDEGSY